MHSSSFTRALATLTRRPSTGARGLPSYAGGGAQRSSATKFSKTPRRRSTPTRPRREWFVNWLRVGAGPAAAYALHRAWVETDLREVLPAVRVPTLVMYRTVGNAERHAREVTDLIPSAHALRVSGTDF